MTGAICCDAMISQALRRDPTLPPPPPQRVGVGEHFGARGALRQLKHVPYDNYISLRTEGVPARPNSSPFAWRSVTPAVLSSLLVQDPLTFNLILFFIQIKPLCDGKDTKPVKWKKISRQLFANLREGHRVRAHVWGLIGFEINTDRNLVTHFWRSIQPSEIRHR